MSDEFRDTVESISAFGYAVTVMFRGPAGQYFVERENERFIDVMTPLLESWRLKQPVTITLHGPTIVDARLT